MRAFAVASLWDESSDLATMPVTGVFIVCALIAAVTTAILIGLAVRTIRGARRRALLSPETPAQTRTENPANPSVRAGVPA